MLRAGSERGTPIPEAMWVHGHDRRFLRALAASGAAQLFQQLQNALFIVAFTRLSTPATYGVWNLAVLTATLVALLAHANIHLAVIRFVGAASDDGVRGARVRMTLRIALLLGIVGSGALFLAAPWIALASGEPQLTALLRWGAPIVLIHSLTVAAQAAMAAGHRMTEVALIAGSTTALEVASVAGSLLLSGDPVIILVSYALARIVTLLAFVTRALAAFPSATRPALRWFEVLAYSLPSLPTAFALWLLSFSDRFILSRFAEADVLGEYAAVTGVMSLLLLAQAPLTAVLFPRVNELWHRGEVAAAKRYLGHATTYLLLILIPAGAAFLLVGDHLLAMITTAPVVVAVLPALPWAVAASVLWALSAPYLTLLSAGDRTVLIGFITLTSGMIAAVISLVLIPRIGVEGAAIARAAGFFAMITGLFLASRALGEIVFDWRTLARGVAATLVMAFVVRAMLPITGWPRFAVVTLTGSVTYLAALVLLERLASPEKRFVLRFTHPDFWTRS